MLLLSIITRNYSFLVNSEVYFITYEMIIKVMVIVGGGGWVEVEEDIEGISGDGKNKIK